MKYSEIEDKAFSILAENNLLNSNSYEVDVHKLVANLSIKLQEKSLGNEISGLLIIKGNKVAIGIDSDQSTQRQRFTIAHELGHYFLHRKLKNTFVDEIFARSGITNQTEKEANVFAASLLMPKESIFKAISEKKWINALDDEKINELAKLFNVSSISMTYRLVNLKLIEQPYY